MEMTMDTSDRADTTNKVTTAGNTKTKKQAELQAGEEFVREMYEIIDNVKVSVRKTHDSTLEIIDSIRKIREAQMMRDTSNCCCLQ